MPAAPWRLTRQQSPRTAAQIGPQAAGLAQEGRELRAERGRDGLLAVRSGGHDGAGVRLGLGGERVAERRRQRLEAVERRGQLQGQAGVHDVLRRGPVVERATLRRRQPAVDLAHQRQDGIAHVGHVGPQSAERSTFSIRQAVGDGLGALGCQLAERGLRPRQRRLRAQPGLDRRRRPRRPPPSAASPKARWSIEKMTPGVPIERSTLSRR